MTKLLKEVTEEFRETPRNTVILARSDLFNFNNNNWLVDNKNKTYFIMLYIKYYIMLREAEKIFN